MKNLTEQDIKSWLTLCTEDMASTFFHTPYWYETATKYLSCGLELIKYKEDSILPTVKYRRGLRRRLIYQSSPFGTYGGIIGDRQIDQNLLLSKLKNKRIFIRTNPFTITHSPKLTTTEKNEFTQYINIPKTANLITKNWSKNHHRSLNKANNYRLVFSIDRSNASASRYFKIYKTSMNRLGKKKTTLYSKKLFDIVSKTCSKQVLFCFISHKDIDIAGGIFFIWNGRIHYWNGTNTQLGLSLGASVFMFYHMVNHSIKEGLELLDFNPSNELEGVILFKSKFGSKKLSCNLTSFGFEK